MNRAGCFPIAALFSYSDRLTIRWVNCAGCPHASKSYLAPLNCRASRFDGVTVALGLHRERPADLRNAFQRRLYLALVFGKTDISNKAMAQFFFDGPKAKSQKMPLPKWSEESCPSVFFGQ